MTFQYSTIVYLKSKIIAFFKMRNVTLFRNFEDRIQKLILILIGLIFRSKSKIENQFKSQLQAFLF